MLGRNLLTAGVLTAAVGLARLPRADTERVVPVVDLHVDLPYQVNYKQAAPERGSGQYVKDWLGRGGVSGVVLPLYIPRDVSPEGPRAEDLRFAFDGVMRFLPKLAPLAPPGCGAHDGKVRTWLAFEGAAPLAAAPGSVGDWVRRGVRLFGLVHTYDNALASSSGTAAPSGALTDAGRRVVHQVIKERAVLDVSHASDAATDEMIRLAREARDAGTPAVVVASHSNARAVAAHPRNLTDEQMRGIAATGGVIGINFHARFLNGTTSAKLEDVVRHVRHAVRVAGVEHVAIGSDFEGGIRPPPGVADIRGFPRLARALRDAGLSERDVDRVFHENALRVLCPAEKAARAAEKGDASAAEKTGAPAAAASAKAR